MNGNNRVLFFSSVCSEADDLRGFDSYRFQGDNLLVMNATRREVFSGLDMAVFGDAGRVSAER